ncbi:hypothetical protein PMAA_015620 [Talaromyces marneffei ATCC 18224]|uniref:Uncharacterized protein n=1 Tax=Talaromyces marneffei (strain ATCC 18224 / CBS 334.59 / QM 7333) TaxID=441960 RepID=B6Q798_TALMQ|nr:hypothetical protein PMAA_015620 [Talaromyces marneffei ATCC 18224]
MWRTKTKYLQHLNEALRKVADRLPDYVECFSLTPSTGGTAIDTKGNKYYSNSDRQEIRYIAPNSTSD